MSLFRLLLPVLLTGIIFLLSGCVMESTTEEVEPVNEDEVNNSAPVQDEKADIVVPANEESVNEPPVTEPTTSAPAKKEGTTNQIPVTLASTTDGLSP